MSDLIERQAAIDSLGKDPMGGLNYERILGSLPSAVPVAKDTNVPVKDCISRQAALGSLGERPVVWSDNDDYTLGARNQYDMDRLALETVPSAQQWIPCDKGEPDEDMECWVTVKTTDALYRGNFTKRYGERRDKGFITSGGFMWWNTALAWMPIYEPEPWKGDTP